MKLFEINNKQEKRQAIRDLNLFLLKFMINPVLLMKQAQNIMIMVSLG